MAAEHEFPVSRFVGYDIATVEFVDVLLTVTANVPQSGDPLHVPAPALVNRDAAATAGLTVADPFVPEAI